MEQTSRARQPKVEHCKPKVELKTQEESSLKECEGSELWREQKECNRPVEQGKPKVEHCKSEVEVKTQGGELIFEYDDCICDII